MSLGGAALAVALALAAAGCRGEVEAAEPEVPVAGAEEFYDVACAICVFGQTDAEGCPPSIRIGERIYPIAPAIEGATGAELSLCDAVQRARVEGRIDGDVFVATSVTLAP